MGIFKLVIVMARQRLLAALAGCILVATTCSSSEQEDCLNGKAQLSHSIRNRFATELQEVPVSKLRVGVLKIDLDRGLVADDTRATDTSLLGEESDLSSNRWRRSRRSSKRRRRSRRSNRKRGRFKKFFKKLGKNAGSLAKKAAKKLKTTVQKVKKAAALASAKLLDMHKAAVRKAKSALAKAQKIYSEKANKVRQQTLPKHNCRGGWRYNPKQKMKVVELLYTPSRDGVCVKQPPEQRNVVMSSLSATTTGASIVAKSVCRKFTWHPPNLSTYRRPYPICDPLTKTTAKQQRLQCSDDAVTIPEGYASYTAGVAGLFCGMGWWQIRFRSLAFALLEAGHTVEAGLDGMKTLDGRKGKWMVIAVSGKQQHKKTACQAKMAFQIYVCALKNCNCKNGLVQANEASWLSKGNRNQCGEWFTNAVSVMHQMYASYHGSILPKERNLSKCLSRNKSKRKPGARKQQGKRTNGVIPTKPVPRDCPASGATFNAGYAAGHQAAMKAGET